jgi:hypothetical protein
MSSAYSGDPTLLSESLMVKYEKAKFEIVHLSPVSVAAKLKVPEYQPDLGKVKKLVEGLKSLDLLKQAQENEALVA